MERYITGSTGQLHLYPRDIAGVVIPIISKPVQQQLSDVVRASYEVLEKAKTLLDDAERKVEVVIAGAGRISQ